MEKGIIFEILNMTAWRVDAPRLFGGFHLTALLITSALAISAAVLFLRRMRRSSSPHESLLRILSAAGWLLAILEIYKQLFLYHIVNGGAYDWWYFPFQLCSVPMYLCILLPLMGPGLRSTCITFMGGYTFISAAAALIYPEDILRSYLSLTVHGFVWHGIILFISLLILMSGEADASAKGLLRALLLFAALCVIAISVNILTQPLIDRALGMHPQLPHDYADMFYLDPAHTSVQPIVSSIQKTAGIAAGLVLYALSIAGASSLVITSSHKMLYPLQRIPPR